MARCHFLHLQYLLHFTQILLSSPTQLSCKNKCGSLELHYPLGSGYGCGSPRFYPYFSCKGEEAEEQVVLSTHTGSYPITTISYPTSTLTISPPLMSTCSSMHPNSNFGLDWPSPFRLSSSTFILLACSSSLITTNPTICDQSSSASHLCASIHSCPSISSLGLQPFSPTTTCCVYSPANLDANGNLDLHTLRCAGYTSVLSLGDIPIDPNMWHYGIELKYVGEVDDSSGVVAARCAACERSEGVCGYAPPGNGFVCVCKNGVNVSGGGDCFSANSNNQVVAPIWESESDGSRAPCFFLYGHYCCGALFVLLVSLVLYV